MPRFDANLCAPLGCLGPTPELLTPVLPADGYGERERSSTPSVYAAMPVAHLVCVPEPDNRLFMRRRGPSAHRTHMSLTDEPQLDGAVTFARHEAGPQFSVAAVQGHRCRGLGQTDHSCMSHGPSRRTTVHLLCEPAVALLAPPPRIADSQPHQGPTPSTTLRPAGQVTHVWGCHPTQCGHWHVMGNDKAAQSREGLIDSVTGKAKEVAGAVSGKDDLVEEGAAPADRGLKSEGRRGRRRHRGRQARGSCPGAR